MQTAAALAGGSLNGADGLANRVLYFKTHVFYILRKVVIENGAVGRIGSGELGIAAAGAGRPHRIPERGPYGEKRCSLRAQDPLDGRGIVQNVESAPVRGEQDVIPIRLQIDIAHGYVGQILEIEWGPVRAGIEGEERAELRTQVQDVWVLQILSQDPDERICWKATGDAGPRFASIGGLIKMRMHVVEHVAIECHVDYVRIAMRGLQRGNRRARGKVLDVGDDVGPLAAAVGGYLEVAVIGAYPNEASFDGGFRNMRDRAINLRRTVVGKDRTARRLPLIGIGIRQ